MIRRAGLLPLVLGMLAMSCTSSGPALPVASSTATAIPTASPTAEPAALRRVKMGETVRLLVRSDAPSAVGGCLELLPFAVVTVPPMDAKAVACTVGSTEPARASFAERGDGALQLVQVYLLFWVAGYPSTLRAGACGDWAPYILDAATDPASATGRVACDYRIEAPGAPQRTVWGLALADSGAEALPATTPCWRLLQYLDAPSDRTTVPVRCVFDPQQ